MSMKSAKFAFGVSVLALAAQIGALHAEPEEAPIKGDDTAIVRGRPADATEPGTASFTINIGNLGPIEKIDLRVSGKTATIFIGSATDENRICPFFNLHSRKYTIKEIKNDIYQITAEVSNEEVEKVTKSGCVVTTRPDLSKIEYLKH